MKKANLVICLLWLMPNPERICAQAPAFQGSIVDSTESVLPMVVLDQNTVLVGGIIVPIDSLETRLRLSFLNTPGQKEPPVIDLKLSKDIPLSTALELRIALKKSSLFKLRYTIDGKRER